ncbi:hypothetical protein HYU14_02250 [Candidatus Woesearchaeota archaeon]|nr:hypothetical protein [Candidatus Woesearchaeota archaeon]
MAGKRHAAAKNQPRKKFPLKISSPSAYVPAFILGILILGIVILGVISRNRLPSIEENLHNFTRAAMIQSNLSLESIDDTAKIKLNIEGDFPDKGQGTFFIMLRVNLQNIISNYGRIPKYLVFFESKKVPGLTVRYNLHDSVIEGGLPLIRSVPVNFLEPEFHNVTYTFREGSPQMIFFDGEKVAEGTFEIASDAITGLAVYGQSEEELGMMDIDGSSAITKDYTLK